MDIHIPIIAATVFAAGATIDEKSLIPIGTACAVGVGIWWLGRKLQRLEDTQENIKDKINSLPCDKNKCRPE